MFKKGQLVKSNFDNLYVVLGYRELFVIVKSLDHGYTDQIPPVRLTLIGNNYRPLSSAAKAKRRYNEMASKVARGEAGYQPAVKSPLSKSCLKDYGRVPPCLK